ncbi:MAG: phosphate-starvation-inducible PsiE family protein [Nitrospinae bacterium]|nr:phosphate-starvation-inducible PsiE family protein [Nitrospinota bacterium]
MEKDRIVLLTGWLRKLSDVVHIVIALSLIISAVFFLVSAFTNLKSINSNSISHLINEILFVLIIMEIFVTVITYLREHRITFQPFLVVGIIASVRKILTIEAHLSVAEDVGREVFFRSMIDLGVNTGIVFILVLSFYLLAKSQGPSECAGCLGIEKATKKFEELLNEKKGQ